jgi:crossover junction endodeoxyribonuclease RuvC
MFSQTPNKMLILGVDPGYDRIGIAIIKRINHSKNEVVYSECFQTSSKDEIYDRLLSVGKAIENIISIYKPDCLAIENLFITKNQKTAMRVSEARGIIIYECKKNGIEIFEYTPMQIKMAITGDGRSDKTRIIKMIEIIAKTQKNKKAQDDEYDAIAVALTHSAYIK